MGAGLASSSDRAARSAAREFLGAPATPGSYRARAGRRRDLSAGSSKAASALFRLVLEPVDVTDKVNPSQVSKTIAFDVDAVARRRVTITGNEWCSFAADDVSA
ncbi:MAG: hypothetical protein M3198_08655 [Actinomycetota bacterium]|nr:hypothetical protein [Actinomycetota bacterium]